MRKKVILVSIVALSLGLIIFLIYQLSVPAFQLEPEKISYVEFLQRNEEGKVGAIYYKSNENLLYGMLTHSPFPVKKILETYDFWVEDVPSEEQLWNDVKTAAKEGNDYGFVMRFDSNAE